MAWWKANSPSRRGLEKCLGGLDSANDIQGDQRFNGFLFVGRPLIRGFGGF